MNVAPHLNRLRAYVESEGFKGYDPYDALNSPFLRMFSLGRPWLRIGLIQLAKRLPVNLRPVLGIRKDYNPKAIGLFLWSYAKLYRIEGRPECGQRIVQLLELLGALRSRGYSGNCWGYNFDWQSRSFFVPRGTPTIVNSSFVGHALIDVFRYTGNQEALALALPIKDFILHNLNRTEENGATCFSYTPLDRTAIHNANLLGASFLIRLYPYAGDGEVKETALASLAYSMRRQREDGSWAYADTAFQNWIDSFHTAFNLQSVHYFLEEGYGEDHRGGFERGLAFYVSHFFLDDGTPAYYHDRVYPIDIHAPAQAIVLLARMGSRFHRLVRRVARWTVENLMDRRGFFYFQKKRAYTIRIPYMRWAQAWAFHALTELLLAEEINNSKC